MTRRAVLFGAAALATGLDASASDVRTDPLFVIARSKNANEIHFDARVKRGGRLDASDPVVAYWIMRAEDGRREALTWLERRFAYGFSTTLEGHGDAARLALLVFPSRAIAVRRAANGRFRAETTIAGGPAQLFRIFVMAKEGGLTPSVRYVDLFGVRLSDGAPVTERILP